MFLSLLQAAAQTVTQTATAAGTAVTGAPTDSVGATLGLSVVVTMIFQALKNSAYFPLISRATGKVNFWIGILAAIASTAGIHGHYDVATGGMIALPSLHVVWQSVVQWATQQAAYKGLTVPAETLGEIRAILALATTPPAPPVSEGAAKAQAQGGTGV